MKKPGDKQVRTRSPAVKEQAPAGPEKCLDSRVGSTSHAEPFRTASGMNPRFAVALARSDIVRQQLTGSYIVTHHARSPRSEAPAYADGPLSPSFVSDLGPLIEQSGIPLWIHGHTHYNVDYRIGRTRVLTNQRGYPREGCVGFDPGLVVEI